jgi:hypothetical protein
VLSETEPLSGKTKAVGGFRQMLVEELSLPSDPTSMWAVSIVPSASEPPVHGNVVVLFIVNDHSPVASA